MKIVSLVFFAILGLGAAAAAVFLFAPLIRDRNAASARLEEVRRTNEVLEAKIGDTQRHVNDLRTNPDFIEVTALREGLARPGEIVYGFAPEDEAK